MVDSIPMNLALQGGGAHGAFTWGVLDRLLREPWFAIESISGTSAGAMNAVMLAEGWRKGGAEGAREQLDAFWREIMLPTDMPAQGLSAPLGLWLQSVSRHLSPYDINPFDFNPLRAALDKLVDFPALNTGCPFHLFIAATEVQAGRLCLFRERELTTEHLLASACLPDLHQAVQIEGRYYWDGGFAGNPAIYPLLLDNTQPDVLLILLQPLERAELPTSSQAIADRVTELGFQTAFMREMRGIVRVRHYLRRRPWLLGRKANRVRRLRFHLIGPDEMLASLRRSSKYDTRHQFLSELKQRGEERAERWLRLHRRKVGRRTSCTLQRYFL